MCDNSDDKERPKYSEPPSDYETPVNRSVIRRVVVSSGRETRTSRHSFSNNPPYEINELHNPAGSRLIKSPQDSPRVYEQELSYNNDATTSTYALQIALKNMKERYQKLQKKITVLEEENSRLINGKSELFGEIGKMQESSIKLREKNLQLNHEVHNKHQECCSLKEQFSYISEDNIKLSSRLLQTSSEKKKLDKQIEELDQENCNLRNGIQEIINYCNNVPGDTSDIVRRLEALTYASKSKFKNHLGISQKTKIVPSSNDIATDMDIYDNMNNLEDDLSFNESRIFDFTKDSESLSIDAFAKAKETTKKMVMLLQKQREELLDLTPLIETFSKDKRLDSTEKNISANNDINYVSRFATCHSSAMNQLTLNISEETVGISPPINDSGGETNVLVEEKIESGNRSPFDWRNVEVSDDETNETSRPEMKTVSTSPDLTLTFDLDDRKKQGSSDSLDDDRTCPMCNAIFPLILPQEAFESHVVSHFEVENGYEVVT